MPVPVKAAGGEYNALTRAIHCDAGHASAGHLPSVMRRGLIGDPVRQLDRQTPPPLGMSSPPRRWAFGCDKFSRAARSRSASCDVQAHFASFGCDTRLPVSACGPWTIDRRKAGSFGFSQADGLSGLGHACPHRRRIGLFCRVLREPVAPCAEPRDEQVRRGFSVIAGRVSFEGVKRGALGAVARGLMALCGDCSSLGGHRINNWGRLCLLPD